MGKTLSLVALMGALAIGHSNAADFKVLLELASMTGDSRGYFTPGRDYYVRLYLENDSNYPNQNIDRIKWDIGEVKGGEIIQAMSPNPLYFFSDYFIGREMDCKTNTVDLTGGVRAIQQNSEPMVNCDGFYTRGLVALYHFQTYTNTQRIELALTNVQACSFINSTSNIPIDLRIGSLYIPSIQYLNDPLKIRKSTCTSETNSIEVRAEEDLPRGFSYMLEESPDLKTWSPIGRYRDEIDFTSKADLPNRFYRFRIDEYR